MLRLKCIGKVVNTTGTEIVGYALIDEFGTKKIIKPNDLKEAILNGLVTVVNLKLTKDARLIKSSRDEVIPVLNMTANNKEKTNESKQSTIKDTEKDHATKNSTETVGDNAEKDIIRKKEKPTGYAELRKDKFIEIRKWCESKNIDLKFENGYTIDRDKLNSIIKKSSMIGLTEICEEVAPDVYKIIIGNVCSVVTDKAVLYLIDNK